MDSITRIKDFIRNNFPEWEKVDYSQYEETIDRYRRLDRTI